MLSRSVTRALARAESSLIVPQPYKLFSEKLLLDNTLVGGPVPSGFQLFQHVADYKAPETNKRVWQELDERQKLAFECPAPEIHRHYLRIQKGYQTAASSSNAFNLFYEASLYPWEIIKDKLRHPPPFAADIYDQLIQEALGAKKEPLRAPNLYYSELVMSDSDLESDIRPFSELPEGAKDKYHAISSQKMEFHRKLRHYFKTKKRSTTEYDDFVQRNSSQFANCTLVERNKALSKIWSQEKLRHKTSHIPSKTRAFRERNLDINTSMVMDYIFEFGTVEGFRGRWRQWKHQVMGDAHYFRQAVFPYILQRRNGQVSLIADYAEYEHLASWRL